MHPDENLRLMEGPADDKRHNRGQKADHEHATPPDHREQHRGKQRRQEHRRLTAERNIGRDAGALAGWPGLGGERHTDSEFATQAKTSNNSISDKIPIAPREAAKTCESSKNQNGPRQYPDSAEVVTQGPKNESARYRTDQRPRDKGACLSLCQSQVRGDDREHETENQHIESVHAL